MAEEATITVRVVQGELRGRKAVSAWGTRYYAFHGIPYAAPPVGTLRFKPPQPAAPWTGVRDATKEGSVAAQLSIISGQYEGDEDCLFLNVYTPRLPSESAGGLLPVMVVVHGGGLMCLSGNQDWIGPDFLIPHDVLMVSFNYRLGVLGFLSTGDSVVPGNMGFKDQVAALRWVRDNIANFGGDADNVTILGSSAGGWSCHALMVSPLAKGLFQRAIAQSGVATGDGVVTEAVRDRSFRLAAHLGCKTTDSRELVDFLSRLPAKDLQENALNARSDEEEARGVMFPFVGTVEPADVDAFLSRSPSDIISSGEFQQVPCIIGVCPFEGAVFVGPILYNPKLPYNYADNPRLLIPSNLRCSDADKDAVAGEIRRFYFGDRDISTDTKKELCDLQGDLMFSYAAVRAAENQSSKSSAKTFFYICNVSREFTGKGTLMEEMMKYTKELGVVAHSSEMGFIHYSTVFNEPAPKRDSRNGKLISKMTRLWTNFAKTGRPTDGSLDVSWPPFTAEDAAYLLMEGKGFCVAHRPFEKQTAFWDGLYRRYSD